MIKWEIERIINFEPGGLWKNGYANFGFHDRQGKQYAIQNQKHFLGPIGPDDRLEWTLAPQPVFGDVPNIAADIKNPMYLDQLPDGTLLVSTGNSRVYMVDAGRMEARLFVDGAAFGMKDMGNCVVDDEGYIWVNEVEGCRVWRFDAQGQPVLTLGSGKPGFQPDTADFKTVRFNWVYDLRKGPDGSIYVLDSKNFALRMIDLKEQTVVTLAGNGKGGYDGDGGDARMATFGSDPQDYFDGPYSLSLDEDGNIYIGDTHNHVVRMIHRESCVISTIAGSSRVIDGKMNDPNETDPFKLNLLLISSMEYYNGRLFVPQWNTETGASDLIVLKKSSL
ncbi:MAG: hypothetical protein ACOY40_00945 [Bacillota bacterium]